MDIENKSEQRQTTISRMISHTLVIRITKPRSFIVLETSLKLRFVTNESENTRNNILHMYPRLLINHMARRWKDSCFIYGRAYAFYRVSKFDITFITLQINIHS